MTAPTSLQSTALAATGPFHHAGLTVLVYDGPVQEVRLRTWMPRFPDPGPFLRIEGTERWLLPLPLPSTARIEYRLAVKQGGRWHEVDDPTNLPEASNPFGRNSVLTGPGYHLASHLTDRTPEPTSHIVEIRVTSAALRGRRHHHVYLPPGFKRGTNLALVVIHDGRDFLEHAGIGPALDHLIASGSIPPLVAVLVDPWQRLSEYAASRDHATHVVHEILPHLQRRLGVYSATSIRALMGASLGAVASLATAWHYPRHFAGLGLLSGTFVHTLNDNWPDEIFRPIASFLETFGREPRVEGYSVYSSVGRYEGLTDFHRRLNPQLRAVGLRLRAVETWDGHHWGAWRDRLGECLQFLFPPQPPVSPTN